MDGITNYWWYCRLSLLISIIYFPCVATIGNITELSTELLEFCHSNGMKFLTFHSSEDERKDVRLFLNKSLRNAKLEKFSIRSKRTTKNETNTNNLTQFKIDNWLWSIRWYIYDKIYNWIDKIVLQVQQL